jgi:hypothetical protein
MSPLKNARSREELSRVSRQLKELEKRRGKRFRISLAVKTRFEVRLQSGTVRSRPSKCKQSGLRENIEPM